MSSSMSGIVVWPAGADWLVLSTADGFLHVANRTPAAIDTEGGLSAAVAGSDEVVAIGPTDRLARSPVLIAHSGAQWQPTEPPGAITPAVGSVVVAGGAEYAVLTGHDGTLVRYGADSRWTAVTDGARLARDAAVTLDTAVWSGTDGIVTGHGSGGAALAYRTTDDGANWVAVPGTSGVAALRPCGAAPTWSVPVIDAGGELRMISGDGRSGDPVKVGSGAVAFGCQEADVFVVDEHGTLEVSSDSGRHWQARAGVPPAVTSLAPIAGGGGYATSAGSTPTLWRVSADDLHFTRVPLPAWVAQLGGQGGDS